MGNILSRNNSGFNTTDDVSRNSEQSYTYDNRDRLTSSNGKFDYETWNPFWNKRVNTYSSDFEYNITGKILRKNQENKGLIEDTGETVTIGETTYDWNYEYGGAQPNAVTKAGTRTFSYDLNGNMTAMMDSSVTLTRSLLWDEENRLKKTTDASGSNSIVTTYGYGADGMRAVKKGKYGTVQYVSENYVVRNKDLISKHVFAGNTRLVSNMVMREEKSGKMVSTEQGCYYYHADHLGSSSVVTDKDGKFYEQLEYFPYGETWVHNKAISDDSAQSTPYKFTGKELDPETGLYYYGARYYDGKLSRWTAVDPALEKYFPEGPDDFDDSHDYYYKNQHDNSSKLKGMGGVYNTINLDLYHYAGQNPVKLVDPDGNAIDIIADIGFIAYDIYVLAKDGGYKDSTNWAALGGDVVGAVVPGLTGVGTGIRAVKTIDKAADVAKAVDKGTDTKKALHRPYIRKNVRETVEARASKTKDGKFRDANTREPIDGKYDLGHKKEHKFSVEKAKAEKEGLSQKEFNNRMNNPDLYQIEKPSNNRSHKFE